MKKVRLLLNIIMIAALSVLLSGCWNYRDINELDVVAGIAVDKSEDGNKYLLTAEIVDIQSQGKEAKISSKRIQIEGETLFDALRNMIRISGRRLYFSHMKIIIISQDVAKEGVTQIVDWIFRDNEPRIELNFVVSKEKTACELFEYQSMGETLNSFSMYEMLRSQKSLSKAPLIEGYRFVQALYSEEESAVLPAVGSILNKGQKTLEVSGTAMFKKDKLVGFLNGDDTKYLLLVKNMMKSSVLPEMGKGENTEHSISLEVFDNKTNINPKNSDGKVSIDVDVKTIVGIDEHSNKGNFIDEKGRNILKSKTEKSIETNMKRVIQKVQDEYDTDIFGFGKEIKIKNPSLWKSISPDWDDLFKKIDVSVNAEVEIRASGFTNRPVNKYRGGS